MINEDDIIAYDLPLLQQRIKAEAAAQGRELKDLSDEELNKRAEEMGGDASNYQSAYTLGRRADGTPGLDINKPRQKTLAQLLRYLTPSQDKKRKSYSTRHRKNDNKGPPALQYKFS